MSSFYTVTSINKWIQATKKPPTGYVETGPSSYTQTSKTGNPADVYHSVYSNTALTAVIPYSLTAAPTPPSVNINATGGTITTVSGIRYHKFTTGGTFRVISNDSIIPISIFAIGGGGGGGVCCGGGGGAGIAVRATLIFDPLKPSQLGAYTVGIGSGGTGARHNSSPTLIFATEGTATTITNPLSQVISCQGGGVGASADYLSDGVNYQSATGGGGGSAAGTESPGGGTSLPSMGFPLSSQITYYPNELFGGFGCDFLDASNNATGAGGAGVTDNGSTTSSGTSDGGNGGSGILYAGVVYGGGGGGAAGANNGYGGSGAGGVGGGIAGGGGGSGATWNSTQNVNGVSAPANSGGGGGGAIWWNGSLAKGGNGGSGVAIFSYPVY